MNTLISAEHNWAIWAILLVAAWFGIWAEKTRIGSKLSGAVMTMALTFVLSNCRVIPAENVPAYDTVWGYLVPLAIPLLLFRADLRRILREAGPTLLAFMLGAIGTIVGTVVAYHLIPLGEDGWKLAAIFSATYVGGSMNYAAASEAVGLRSGDLLTAGVAADNLVMALYFLVLFALPSMAWLRRGFPDRSRDQREADPDRLSAPEQAEQHDASALPALQGTTLSLALAAGLCAAGFALGRLTGLRGSGILFVTALTVVLATTLPGHFKRLRGADVLGAFFMQIFFAVIGASANIAVVLRVGPVLFFFAALILTIHLVFLLLGGRLLRLDLKEIVIASNANMGGPTTAAAMAAARKWQHLVLPAILCGTLGYSIATFIGVGLGNWLK